MPATQRLRGPAPDEGRLRLAVLTTDRPDRPTAAARELARGHVRGFLRHVTLSQGAPEGAQSRLERFARISELVARRDGDRQWQIDAEAWRRLTAQPT